MNATQEPTSGIRQLVADNATGVILLYGTACPPCARLKPILAAVTQRMGVDLHQFNVATEMDFARANAIRGVPTVLAIREGVVTTLFTGEIAQGGIENMLVDALFA